MPRVSSEVGELQESLHTSYLVPGIVGSVTRKRPEENTWYASKL